MDGWMERQKVGEMDKWTGRRMGIRMNRQRDIQVNQ
jgi:hypothetical protein